MGAKLNLFVQLKDGSIKRINVSLAVQKKVTEYFVCLKNVFYTDQTDEINFDGRYSIDECNTIFAIKNFKIDENILKALQNPLEYEIVKMNEDENNIKGIICGFWNDNEKYALFQAFDCGKLLSKKFTLIHSGNTFTKLSEPGIIINDRIDALFIDKDNKLIFNSYNNAKRLFDLSEYYKEATDEDLKNFAKDELFFCEDIDWFIKNSDSVIRKKVALLTKNDVLKVVSFEKINKISKKFGITIENIENNKIKFPKDKKQIKEIVKLLEEDYFESIFTKRKCITNSKQYLE